MKHETYRTGFCNHEHRLSDGKPINHKCFIMPTEALYAERDQKASEAEVILSQWKNRRAHSGLKIKENDA